MTTVRLAPAGFLVAGLALGGVGLFPLRDRLRFVVVHLLVHAGAIIQHHFSRRAGFVVGDALVDPFHVVGGDGEGGVAGKSKSGEREREGGGFHGRSPRVGLLLGAVIWALGGE